MSTMKVEIILAPYSAGLRTGNPNPKNFPHWPLAVSRLRDIGYEVVQIGTVGENRIEGVSQFIQNWPLKKLRVVLEDADCFLTIDSFLPHFIYAEKINKRGVVVFSQSDPAIFGHPQNINLLKSREYLRPLQYQDWVSATYNEAAFVSAEEVVNAVVSLVTSTRPTNRAASVSSSVSVAV
jgi:hypothetical protein